MLGDRIRRLRQSQNLSQQQLADALHISASAVGMYEQERRIPCLELVVALAELFDVSLDYLITGREYCGHKPPACLDGCQLSIHAADGKDVLVFRLVQM